MHGDDDIMNVPQVNEKDQDPRISRAKILRMRHRENKKHCLIYPEDQPKVYWDLFITTVLLTSCLLTPFRLAFGELEDPVEWIVINYSIDACFLIDIIIIFNSAFYNNEF